MDGKRLRILIAGLLLIVLAACTGDGEGEDPTATVAAPQVVARQLATVGPTNTPNATEAFLALRATPTITLPTATPTETPYVGVFIGEVAPDPLGGGIGELNSVATRPAAGISLICETPPDEATFGLVWQTEPRVLNALRCPIQQSYGFNGIAQIFEGGVMYVNGETSEVWAIVPAALSRGGLPDAHGRFWKVDNPAAITTDGFEAPAGFYVPVGQLGAVWVSVPEARELLGYALVPAENQAINVQRFEGGWLLLDVSAGQVFALLVNGDAYGPY